MASEGWLQHRALIAHLNSVHLSLPGVRLPGEFAQTVNVCPRCRLIVNSRGCPSCQGKSGRASDAPRVQMDVDAAPQPLRESVPAPLETLTTKVSMMQHVPKAFRIDCAEELNHFCDEQTMEAFALLLLLPKAVLLATDRGGRRAKRQVLNVCRGRATAWKEQAWNTLWSLSLKKKVKVEPRTRAGQKNEKLRQRIRRVMADKGISKAARELVSDGIHEVVRLEQRLPGIGLELNLRKCVLVSSCTREELSRFPHLVEVSHVDIRDENQGFKVLGVPMGGRAYVQKALEDTTAKMEEFCEQVVNLDHPQMGFILLRQCCGTCRVVHLLRAMDTNHTSRLVEAVDKSVMDSALRMLRTPCAENARTQITLPLRFSGCGLTRASDIAPLAAFTGRWSFYDKGSEQVHLPKALISEPPATLLRFF